MVFFTYIIIGMLGGVLSGMLGIGGGVVVVPGLLLILHWHVFAPQQAMHIAVATSLATIVVTTFMAMCLHQRHGSVQWQEVRKIVPIMLLGAVFGAGLGQVLSTELLRSAFAFFTLLLGLNLLLKGKKKHLAHPVFKHGNVYWWSILSGSASGLLGIGGGILMGPWFISRGFSMPQVSATAATCAIPTASVGALTFVILGWGKVDLLPYSSGYVYWPAVLIVSVGSLIGTPIGVFLVNKLNDKVVKKIFAMMLLIISFRMLPFS